MTTTFDRPAQSLAEIRARNAAIGHHFFEPSAMRFFRSRCSGAVYPGTRSTWFVTSEQFDSDSPRLYSVRVQQIDGTIDTVGEFQQYATSREARAVAARLAKGEA